MKKYYTFDIYGLNNDEQNAIVAEIEKHPIRDNGEIIARAYEWLDTREFLEFMDYWKSYDYPQMVYGNLYGEERDLFIMAFEATGIDEIRVGSWRVR